MFTIQFSGRHELLKHFIGNFSSSFLMPLHNRCERIHKHFLQLPRQQSPTSVVFFNLLQPLVILQKECQILKRNVNLTIPTEPSVVLYSRLSAGKCVLINLILQLLGGVGQIDRRVRIRGGHFGSRPLQRGEKARVQQCGFLEADSGRNVARHSEIGILVDRARNEAG